MAKKRKRTKKPVCKNGFACGFGCISRSRTCRSNVDEKGNKLIESYTQFLSREAQLTENNEVIKIGEITEREIEALKELGPKGLSPKLLGTDGDPPDKVAMSLSKGKPVFREFEVANDEKIEKIIKSNRAELFNLHKEGWAHNDAHDANILYDESGNKSNLIDFGLASKENQNIISEAMEGSSFALLEIEDREPVEKFIDDQTIRVRETAIELLKDGISPNEVSSLTRQNDFFNEGVSRMLLENPDISPGSETVDNLSPNEVSKYLNILYKDVK